VIIIIIIELVTEALASKGYRAPLTTNFCFFLFFKKYFIDGLTAGAVKG
jgi:ABC-type glycerol-3-phosphate transport system permease component